MNLIKEGLNGVYKTASSLAKKHGQNEYILPQNYDDVAKEVIEIAKKYNVGKTMLTIILSAIDSNAFPNSATRNSALVRNAFEFAYQKHIVKKHVYKACKTLTFEEARDVASALGVNFDDILAQYNTYLATSTSTAAESESENATESESENATESESENAAAETE